MEGKITLLPCAGLPVPRGLHEARSGYPNRWKIGMIADTLPGINVSAYASDVRTSSSPSTTVVVVAQLFHPSEGNFCRWCAACGTETREHRESWRNSAGNAPPVSQTLGDSGTTQCHTVCKCVVASRSSFRHDPISHITGTTAALLPWRSQPIDHPRP